MICGLRTVLIFFFNDTATAEIYTLSLHDALPILALLPDCAVKPRDGAREGQYGGGERLCRARHRGNIADAHLWCDPQWLDRSEEHTSELQSRQYLVCRLLLEKTKRISQTCIKVYI